MTALLPKAPSERTGPSLLAASWAGFARRTFGALSLEQARAELEVRPDRVAAVWRPGPDPYKILLFGGGVLEGVGLRDHNLGLPGRLADVLMEQTRRGIEVDVVVDSDPTSARALNGLEGLRLRRFDAVIVVLGEQAALAQLDLARYRGAFVGLTKTLLAETAPAAGVFIYDSARAVLASSATSANGRAGIAAARHLESAEQLCAVVDRARFSELRPAPGMHGATSRFSESVHRDWAERITTRLKPTFAELARAPEQETPKYYRNRPDDERFRQRALDSLRLRSRQPSPQLHKEIEQAKHMFQLSMAAINIVDGEVQWPLASTSGVGVSDRSESFCDFAIRSEGLTLINDTLRDSRTVSNPRANGGGLFGSMRASPSTRWTGTGWEWSASPISRHGSTAHVNWIPSVMSRRGSSASCGLKP